MTAGETRLAEGSTRLLPPGVMLRSFRGQPDLPDMLAVVRESQDFDGVDYTSEEEVELRGGYASLFHRDLSDDLAIVEAEGRVVGFARLWWMDEFEGRAFWHSGYVIPGWRRRGIGRALVRRLGRRASVLAASAGRESNATLTVELSDREVAAARLLMAEGYERVRAYTVMVHADLADVEPAPLPDGLELRSVRSEHVRAIWEADQEAISDHWGAGPPSKADYEAWLRTPVRQQHEIWQVAWSGDQVAGQVRTYIDAVENERFGRLRGYTENVTVRRPWRRRGLGRALMLASLSALRESGMTEAALGVDVVSAPGAMRLYRSVGFAPLGEQPLYRRALGTPSLG